MNLLEKIFAYVESTPAKDLPIYDIMDNCGVLASCGLSGVAKYKSIDNKYLLTFIGHMYEPTYEYFVPGCNIKIKDLLNDKEEVLYAVDGVCVDAYKYKEVVTGDYNAAEAFIKSLDTRFIKVEN
jgi:hypothetical protein